MNQAIRGIVPEERVVGLHMNSFPYWLDFWNGDEAALIKAFGSLSECQRYDGGTDKNALHAAAGKPVAPWSGIHKPGSNPKPANGSAL